MTLNEGELLRLVRLRLPAPGFGDQVRAFVGAGQWHINGVGHCCPPRGDLESAVLGRIDKIYTELQMMEPCFDRAINFVEIAIVLPEALDTILDDKPVRGTSRMLSEVKHQFDIVTELSDCSQYWGGRSPMMACSALTTPGVHRRTWQQEKRSSPAALTVYIPKELSSCRSRNGGSDSNRIAISIPRNSCMSSRKRIRISTAILTVKTPKKLW